MANSVFDIFKIGIGPSSSHTVGPMVAAALFAHGLEEQGIIADVRGISCELFGSLALTGLGHGTDRAIQLGLMGEKPDTVDPAAIGELIAAVQTRKSIKLLGKYAVAFDEPVDLVFWRGKTLPGASNAIRFTSYGVDRTVLAEQVYFSIGGGFVVTEQELLGKQLAKQRAAATYDFASAAELLVMADTAGLSIANLMLANERCWRSDAEITAGLRLILTTMRGSIDAGKTHEGVLPGGLNLRRRAPELYKRLEALEGSSLDDPLAVVDWISFYAIAVGEENAAGGRSVTAPTLGSAGVIPAVLAYYENFCQHATEQGTFDLLLTAAAIGTLYKRNASIAAAEVGCQGEIGAAGSMAAGGFVAAMGGTAEQISSAAEIAMEHMLGLTCDPIGGLVQIPCIERTAMAAVEALTAARLAMDTEQPHYVSLDRVIDTMRRTGADMSMQYKETSLGGLAVEFHLPKC
ncbi:MAG: L-serine ammonia-lyase [Candidatus Velthaea sp.]|jgi:L-serine dehydratase